MRIISGKLKGMLINPPKGIQLRPTMDFAREGLFNILESRYFIDKFNILDLFCGSGTISFEFISHGAKSVIAVDINNKSIQFISRKAHELELDNLSAVREDALKFLELTHYTYHLIFADPPYNYEHYNTIIEIVFRKSLLEENGILILEHGQDKSFKNSVFFVEQRNYGNTRFSFFKINS